MPAITIDSTTCDTDTSSAPARDAISRVQRTDRVIERLEAELALLRAHRRRHVYDVEKGAAADLRSAFRRI